MTDVDGFLGQMLPVLRETDTALHNGDPAPRTRIWSHNAPVTLFGAASSASGWPAIERIFEWLAARFSGCTSFDYEILAADVSGDLAYIVGVEHTTASVGTAVPESYSLRVTTIFRREEGHWKVVHRHGDPLPEDQGAQLQLKRMRTDDLHTSGG
jgi:ketosteroid isomerase-like protein